MRPLVHRFSLWGCLAAATAVGCGKGGGPPGVLPGDGGEPGTDSGTATQVCKPGQPLPRLAEDRAVYSDDSGGVLEIKLIVPDLEGLKKVDGNVEGATVEAIFTEGDFGSAASAPNATLSLRGSTSRLAFQKSYQVKLTNKMDLWRGQRVVNLLKHPFDLTRVREHVSMDYFRTVPSFAGLRTRFAHVVLNDLDMGLYEWVEEPDHRFLESHGLDPQGTLYKSKTFGFLPIDANVLSDPVALDALISAKANPDPGRLDAMVQAVNDLSMDIDAVVARYFDRENYLTWLAVNLLFQDFDTGSQNFMLYSPSGCSGFYFLPWDYDGAWGWYEQPGNLGRPRWRTGLANWWWVPLHQRFLSKAANRRAVDDKITELLGSVVSDVATTKLMSGYHDTVRRYISDPAGPDFWNLPTAAAGTDQAVADWQTEYDRVAAQVGAAKAELARTKTRPMPFWLYMPVVAASGVTFSWGPAMDVAGVGVTYDLDVASALDFNPASITVQKSALTSTEVTLSLSPGKYYWRVTARRIGAAVGSDDWQRAFQEASMLSL